MCVVVARLFGVLLRCLHASVRGPRLRSFITGKRRRGKRGSSMRRRPSALLPSINYAVRSGGPPPHLCQISFHSHWDTSPLRVTLQNALLRKRSIYNERQAVHALYFGLCAGVRSKVRITRTRAACVRNPIIMHPLSLNAVCRHRQQRTLCRQANINRARHACGDSATQLCCL